MNKKLFRYQIIGFIFVSITGTLSHFAFEWLNYNKIAGLVFPINESTWEHLKLLFFPYLIWSIFQYCFLIKKKSVFMCSLISVIIGMTTIVTFYYTYTGIIGKNIDAINIFSFFLGVFITFVIDYILLISENFSKYLWQNIGIAGLLIITALFFIFTIAPPFLPLFKDPINSTYGI